MDQTQRTTRRPPSPRRSRIFPAIAVVTLTVFASELARAAPRPAFSANTFASAPSSSTGDAQHGVAEQTGAFTYSFPFEVPPGRLGMEAKLSLTYHSDGPIYGGVAAGWTLDVPVIARDTADGILDGVERWQSSLAGGERLIPTTEPRGLGVDSVFRARNEEVSIAAAGRSRRRAERR